MSTSYKSAMEDSELKYKRISLGRWGSGPHGSIPLAWVYMHLCIYGYNDVCMDGCIVRRLMKFIYKHHYACNK